jgi:hypothetical protein
MSKTKNTGTKESLKPQAEQEAAAAREPEVTEPQAEPTHSSVIAGKRYDFSRARSDASGAQEEYQAIPIRQSYEDVRDQLSHTEARLAWRDADRQKSYLRAQMQLIHDDESLSDEGKRDAAQRLIDTNAPEISQAYEGARAKLESSAESSWKFSIPMPNDKTLATTSIADTSEMIAVQNEADSLAQRIEGKSLQAITQERSKDPRSKGIRGASNHTLKELQAEFDSAMHTGGVEGRIKAFAIKRYVEAKGMSLDDVVDSHRKTSHRGAYRDAEVFERAYSTVPKGTRGLENPYDSRNRRRGSKAVGAYQSGNAAISGSGTSKLFAKKRRKPHWK